MPIRRPVVRYSVVPEALRYWRLLAARLPTVVEPVMKAFPPKMEVPVRVEAKRLVEVAFPAKS